MLEPLIDHRLDCAGGDLGRIVLQATSALDDRIVAERLADLRQDATLSWQDRAHLRTLGATVVNGLPYQGERKGWDAGRTDTAVRTGLSDLYAGSVEAAIGQDPERAAIQAERQAAVERKIERARKEPGLLAGPLLRGDRLGGGALVGREQRGFALLRGLHVLFLHVAEAAHRFGH
jgi:hypothetical protein